MSSRILLQEHPRRSLALVTQSHVLVFRHNPALQGASVSAKTTPPKCIVEFSNVDAIDLTNYRPLITQNVHGTLGLININTDVFLCVISGAQAVATLRPGENVQRIISVEFFCLTRSEFDYEWRREGAFYDFNEKSTDIYDSNHGLDYKEAASEHPCLALKHALGDGTFYYSVDFDLTNRLQNRISEESAFDVDNFDHGFLWNSYMIEPLIRFRSHLSSYDRSALDASHILTSAIRGYVSSITIPASSSPIGAIETKLPSTLTLISRLSWYRAGTRFNARGIDDEGNVANFVETETVYYFPNGLCFSFGQVRGSVPLFWEQATGLLPQQQKIQITRSPEATQPAFNKHFADLELRYGTIHILNLLGDSKPGEVELTTRYNHHIHQCSLNKRAAQGSASDHAMLKASHFDFHAETKGSGGYEAAQLVRHLIRGTAEGFAFFLSEDEKSFNSGRRDSKTSRPHVTLQQEGVFRTNCLDCLDRTNLIQTIISQMALESFFRQLQGQPLSDFWMRHSTLWADNGDALSKIYAGTGALKSSFTRHGKMSFAGALADARKSATRIYMNNFADKDRQIVIDTLLGRLVDQHAVQLYDPINDYVNAELARRAGEYTRAEDITIWVGTFNLNGKGRGMKEDLSAWLCPKISNSQPLPEVVAVGFQEIVELTANNIMSTDPKRRQEWELAVARTLNHNAGNAEEYVLLRSGQLVGAALIVFVKAKVLPLIKNVEGSIKKTGLSGMAGNKGAVAIRMDYASTRICFVTAHLAAGFANYDERNRDYETISHGLRFQRNRSIEDHDTIIWLGDFNYRIGLDNSTVRQYIQAGDLGNLFKNDQLNLQMVAGNTFPFYHEAPITFLPTYKYDNGTDQYDTSEKARIPAWCDRILWKGENLKQIIYDAAPLRFSDHRPVFGTFQCTIRVEDETIKQRLSYEIYIYKRDQLRRSVAPGAAQTDESDDADADALGFESISPGLAPASSESRKWWLSNGLPARSNIAETHKGQTANPRRPANPFSPSEEPDWIIVSSAATAGTQSRGLSGPPPNLPKRPSTTDAAELQGLGTGNSNSTFKGGSSIRPFEAQSLASPSSGSKLKSSSPEPDVMPVSSKKVAPLVPRKPLKLASISSSQRSLEQRSSLPLESRDTGGIGGIDARQRHKTAQVINNNGDSAALPGHPSKAIVSPTSQKKPAAVDYSRPTVVTEALDPVPTLPPRTSNQGVIRNMMDEENEGAKNIPSLQPFRAR